MRDACPEGMCSAGLHRGSLNFRVAGVPGRRQLPGALLERKVHLHTHELHLRKSADQVRRRQHQDQFVEVRECHSSARNTRGSEVDGGAARGRIGGVWAVPE